MRLIFLISFLFYGCDRINFLWNAPNIPQAPEIQHEIEIRKSRNDSDRELIAKVTLRNVGDRVILLLPPILGVTWLPEVIGPNGKNVKFFPAEFDLKIGTSSLIVLQPKQNFSTQLNISSKLVLITPKERFVHNFFPGLKAEGAYRIRSMFFVPKNAYSDWTVLGRRGNWPENLNNLEPWAGRIRSNIFEFEISNGK